MTGLRYDSISERLHVPRGSLRLWKWKHLRNMPISPLPRRRMMVHKTKVAESLIMAGYVSERRAVRRFDEQHHWWHHPERVRFMYRNLPSYLAERKAAQERFAGKCCGTCDKPLAPSSKHSIGALAYCSKTCQGKAYRERRKARGYKAAKRERTLASKLKRREWLRRHYHTQQKHDLSYKIKHRINSRLHKALKAQSATKSGRTFQLAGCTVGFFKRWIEEQFKRGMTWENWGTVWHIDHVMPLSRFNLLDPAQQRIAYHYSNLRPLYALENMAKGAKVVTHQPELPISLCRERN